MFDKLFSKKEKKVLEVVSGHRESEVEGEYGPEAVEKLRRVHRSKEGRLLGIQLGGPPDKKYRGSYERSALERKRKLRKLVAASNTRSMARVIRDLIDKAYEDLEKL